jgi:hypothetical protein
MAIEGVKPRLYDYYLNGLACGMRDTKPERGRLCPREAGPTLVFAE